jgi:hypothetical protein
MSVTEQPRRKDSSPGEPPASTDHLDVVSTLSDLVQSTSSSELLGRMLVDLGAFLGDVGRILQQSEPTGNVYLSLMGDLGKRLDDIGGDVEGTERWQREAKGYLKTAKEEIAKGDKASPQELARALRGLYFAIKEKIADGKSETIAREGFFLALLVSAKSRLGQIGGRALVSYQSGPPARVCFEFGPSHTVCAKVKHGNNVAANEAARAINEKLVKCKPPEEKDWKNLGGILEVGDL